MEKHKKIDTKAIEYHIAGILKALGDNPEREGLKDTPKRVAKMYEEVFDGMNYTNEEIADMFNKTFALDMDEEESGGLPSPGYVPDPGRLWRGGGRPGWEQTSTRPTSMPGCGPESCLRPPCPPLRTFRTPLTPSPRRGMTGSSP